MDENVINLILSIIPGLCAAIPSIIYLVKFIETSVREKNWTVLVTTVLNLMAQAEKSYSNGADRKQWVMNELKALEPTLNVDIDEVAISNMIDAICATSKQVNVK